MTLGQFVSKLDCVRQTANRFIANCPAHDDRHPSLSIKEGDRGLLVHCFSGCHVKDIVQTMGLKMADLFYDAASSSRATDVARPRIDPNRVSFAFKFYGDLLLFRAEGVLNSAKHIDIAEWTDDELDLAMSAVGKAYEDQAKAMVFYGVAFKLRQKVIFQEAKLHAA